MYGTIIGDIVGSIYEHHNIRNKDFELFDDSCSITDDTVMSCAIAKAMCEYKNDKDKEKFQTKCIEYMREIGVRYISAGYGGTFLKWLVIPNPQPYNSYGNGAAMRVSSIGMLANTLEEAEALAEISASVTHNHPEGIKGAKAMASAIWMLKNGYDKMAMKEYIEQKYYSLNVDLELLKEKIGLDVSCEGTVPPAIKAFLDSENFEDCIRTAISIGGDSDTIAAMAGALAEVFYKVPENIKSKAQEYLKSDLLEILNEFYKLEKSNSKTIKITPEDYASRFPNNNEEYFNKLDQREQDAYLECINYYYSQLIEYLIGKLDLIKYDQILSNSKNNFIPTSEDKMAIYQRLSSSYLKYLYLRNNLYIENLSNEEILRLRQFMQQQATLSNQELYRFIENTYQKVISETKEVTTMNYGPENPDFFADSNSIIIGLRTDDFADSDKIENWSELHNKREFELDFFLNYLKVELNGKLPIPVSVIRYNDFSVKKRLNQNKK